MYPHDQRPARALRSAPEPLFIDYQAPATEEVFTRVYLSPPSKKSLRAASVVRENIGRGCSAGQALLVRQYHIVWC